VESLAHGLKGACATIGAAASAAAARELETLARGQSLDSAGELFARLERELERLDQAITEHRERREAA